MLLILDPGIYGPQSAQRFEAVHCQEILEAPGISGLVDGDFVSPRQELCGNAAQEMRVPVVPV
jgi:hypothetical protein